MGEESADTASTESSTAVKTTQEELEKRISSLEKELQNAKLKIDRLKRGGGIDSSSDDNDFDGDNDDGSDTDASPPVILPGRKRGYLFKWMDREIGWGGTKWALRFVTLENGRISYYGSHLDSSPRYSLTLRGCAARDDGVKLNRRHKSKDKNPPPLDETGAYFFLFSIYLQPDIGQDDSEVSPLLRFSTPTMAEKNQWIQLISDSCEYCETDDFITNEAQRAAELALQQQQQASMALAMPEAKRGTLPPLFFAPPPAQESKRSMARSPSSSKRLYRTKSKQSMHVTDKEEVDGNSVKGYPQSKPMHRSAAASYLSPEAPIQNYRGLFNLGIIVLVVSNFRLILGTIRQEGFVLERAWEHLKELPHYRDSPWQEFPFISGLLLNVVFLHVAFVIEYLLSRRRVNETFGMLLHHFNAHSSLIAPIFIVWNIIDNPITRAVVLFQATITWMKLISYMLANEDLRLSTRQDTNGKNQPHASLSLISHLDIDEMEMKYPDNVKLSNLFYFWVAPTLTYQLAFPKVPRVKYSRVVLLALRMLVTFSVFSFLIAQIVSPTLDSLVKDLEGTNGSYTAGILAEYWLRLAIANTYLWLLVFYFYFHLYLNFFAEILRYGDRVFYKDWWNSSDVSAYWRLWNMPVHMWLVRHVYFPCVRLKLSRQVATLIVFTISAVMHELLISVPFHMIRPWTFLGMMAQIPLVAITKYISRKLPGSSIGNIVFWVTFCLVGQPMAILLYTIDYRFGQYMHDHPPIEGSGGLQCRFMWNERCIIK